MEGSDADILNEFSEQMVWVFLDSKEFLEEILGVDLVSVEALRP